MLVHPYLPGKFLTLLPRHYNTKDAYLSPMVKSVGNYCRCILNTSVWFGQSCVDNMCISGSGRNEIESFFPPADS